MNHVVSNAELQRVTDYLEANFKTCYEWINDNTAVCKKSGLAHEEFLDIVSFEFENNRAASAVWKEILSTAVGLNDGVERTSIKDFYDEKRFSDEDIYDAVMYASNTFAKHTVKKSHREVIANRFALCKQLCRTNETPEENEHSAQVLSGIGLPKDNAIYRFLANAGLPLEDASRELNKSMEEIVSDFAKAITMLKNRQHKLFDKKPIETDTPDSTVFHQNVLCIIKDLTQRERAVITYLLGIPDDLNDEDFENPSSITPKEPHTYGETSIKFGISIERIRQIVNKAARKGGCPRRKRS